MRRQRSNKWGGVEGGEREESTPKLVAAGSRREVPLAFKVPAKGVGKIRETTQTASFFYLPGVYSIHVGCEIYQGCIKVCYPK